MKRSATIKVGLLTLVGLGLFIFTVIWLQGANWGDSEEYHVLFPDVDGLKEGAPVQIMGIRVGFIDTIQPKIVHGKYYVDVGFSIQNDTINIPNGSTLSLEQSGLIGEKFLEITPPQLRLTTVSKLLSDTKTVEPKVGMPIKLQYKEGWIQVGTVEKVEPLAPVGPKTTQRKKTKQYILSYRITLPGARLPKNPASALAVDENNYPYLEIHSTDKELPLAPDKDLVFTVESPLRMKEFLEIQLQSAESLKVTNEKISQLLNDDTIATLNSTLDNVEELTSKSSDILDSADALLKTTSRDLELLVQESRQLSSNIQVVSQNVNDIIGDPRFKDDILDTMDSINSSTKALNDILQEGSIQETLAMTKETTRSVSEVAKVVEGLAKDRDLQDRLDKSLTLLNDSLTKLSVILDEVETTAQDPDGSLKGIITETKTTTKNLKKFSEKLNKRFLLFRLMF